MRGSRADRLLHAVLAAQGAEPLEGFSTNEIAYARRLVEARQRDAGAEVCPSRARHRAYALAEQLPASPWELLAHLVLDSWTHLAPAARSLGSDRLRRYENAHAAVDVQVGREPSSQHHTLAIAVEDCGESCTVQLALEGGARTLDLALDEYGTGSVRLEDDVQDVVVVVSDEDGQLLRTPPVPFR